MCDDGDGSGEGSEHGAQHSELNRPRREDGEWSQTDKLPLYTVLAMVQ